MHCYTYKIPLHPSAIGQPERKGIIIQTEQGWGEAAPLPGFSKDPLDALVFALSSAMKPFPKTYPKIPLSALASTEEEAMQAVQLGFQTLKFKVKNKTPEEAAQQVSRLQSLNLRLRIDGNRFWNLEEARSFLDQIDPKGIEYIEEPIKDPRELSELPPFPFALDETLLETDGDALASLPTVKAFVLKPTLLGDQLGKWIQLGQKTEKMVVFSSSFESAIGLIHIAKLQETYAPHIAAGLDTFRSFKHNFLPFPIELGRLREGLIPPIDRTWLMNSVL